VNLSLFQLFRKKLEGEKSGNEPADLNMQLQENLRMDTYLMVA
jgi:hypothetical protein